MMERSFAMDIFAAYAQLLEAELANADIAADRDARFTFWSYFGLFG